MVWFRQEQRDRELFDVKFYPADLDGVDSEAFFTEVNDLLARRARFEFIDRDDLF